MTMHDFIITHGLTMTTTPVDSNPHVPDSSMRHYRCTLRNATTGVRRSVIFSLGSGHGRRTPELEEVVDCLVAEAAGCDQDFEGWCGDYGYESDSRRGHAIYKACQQNAAKLKALVGDDYDTLLYDTERL